MSVENVKAAIKTFLASGEAQVLCIRGAWGTGKTYTWQDIAKKQRDVKNGVALGEYAYVSLFGLNTLSELRSQILQHTVPRNQIGNEASIETLSETLGTLDRGAKKGFIQTVTGLLGSRADTLISAIGLLTHKQIICIDDLERKGAKLSNGDVLGFVSYLKEERKCKVVLLLNDVQLDDRKTFDSYLEKVVDIYLKFEPTPTEIADIAIKGKDQASLVVRESAIALGINNVRVIRKIVWLVHQAVPLLDKYAPIATLRAIKSITLLGWSFLSPETAPPLDYLKRVNVYASMLEDNDLHVKWRDKLLDYEFTQLEDFDLTLLDGVENGYFDQEKIDLHASELHRADARENAQNALRAVWEEMFNSFKMPAAQILTRFHDTYVANAEFIGLGDMLSLEKLFRQLKDDRSHAIVDRYIEVNQDNPSAFDTEELEQFGTSVTSDIQERFATAANNLRRDLAPIDILLNLRENGFDEEALHTAAGLPIEDYLHVLKNAEGETLSNVLSGVRQYLKISNPPPGAEKIMMKAALVLKSIASESDINNIRATRYGLIQWLDKYMPDSHIKQNPGTPALKSES
jgi:hypothetical protein